MAVMTIRNLDDEVRDKLRIRAAHNRRSMEAEVRAILADAVESSVERTSIEVLLGLCEPAGPDFADFLPRREPYQPRVTFE